MQNNTQEIWANAHETRESSIVEETAPFEGATEIWCPRRPI